MHVNPALGLRQTQAADPPAVLGSPSPSASASEIVVVMAMPPLPLPPQRASVC